jgi:hypothetical protein
VPICRVRELGVQWFCRALATGGAPADCHMHACTGGVTHQLNATPSADRYASGFFYLHALGLTAEVGFDRLNRQDIAGACALQGSRGRGSLQAVWMRLRAMPVVARPGLHFAAWP